MQSNLNQLFSKLLAASAFSLATLFAVAPGSALAYDTNSTAAINVDQQGVGIHGYDPVAYFTHATASVGQAKFSASHEGVTYHFANAKQRDMFKAEPAKYAPQYGGFCAMGVALGKKLDGDPQAWRVVDGKLYLNVNKEVQKKWLENVPGNLQKAQEEWPGIKDKAPKDL